MQEKFFYGYIVDMQRRFVSLTFQYKRLSIIFWSLN